MRLSGEDWRLLKDLYPDAGATPTSLGNADVAYRNPYRAHLCLVHGFRPCRGRRRGYRRKSAKWREPRLLATSLESATAAEVVAVYGTRMQIEETFRDMKDARWGLALTFARNRTIARSRREREVCRRSARIL